MTPRQSVRAYVNALSARLDKLDPADADEVLREIESHIQEVIDQAEARDEALDIEAVLQGFGPPEALAAQYVAHVRTGAPPPAGFRVIQGVRQTATRGLYYSMGALGFLIALALLLLALAKVAWPESVGVWSTAGGESIAIAWMGSPYPESDELLGYGLIPIALLASAWCAEVTRRVLRVLHRGLTLANQSPR